MNSRMSGRFLAAKRTKEEEEGEARKVGVWLLLQEFMLDFLFSEEDATLSSPTTFRPRTDMKLLRWFPHAQTQ